MNVADQYQMQLFLQQLAQWATQAQNPGGFINSQPGSIQGGALQTVSRYLNAVSGTQTVQANNGASIMVEINITGNTTLVLANLMIGIPVVVKASGAHTLKMNATDGAGTAYAISAKNSSLVDMVATGVSASGTVIFAGNSDYAGATPSLWFLYN